GQFDIDLGARWVEAGGERIPLTAAIESLLFVAAEPVEPAELARSLGLDRTMIDEALSTLAQQYTDYRRGLRLQERNGKVQLVTLPAAASLVESFLSLDLTTRLSAPALETLAVIAYRQPVTRSQIESVRGVDCAGVLRSLLQRGLIEETGRLEVVGRPILYGVTDLFYQTFGLTNLSELPPLAPPDAELLESVTRLGPLEVPA
ncbi:MAG TPA: SMC-Scp complex subunit ScpB, partial [Caldilineaceae bacterium]|nr:SMC-Scp complex subunit ScpB [Caldilineaceae bacterium]